jgi:hypothetical protein
LNKDSFMESQEKVDAAPPALRCSPVRLYEFNAIGEKRK